MERTIQKCIEVDGSFLHVDVYGEPDGPAIVLIPGVMADAAGWADVARHLDAWATVAVVNRRGRHPSGPLAAGYDLDSELADATAVLREVRDVRTLFGWSYGGLIALHLANHQAVPHVIAYEPVMHPFGAHALSELQRAHEESDLDAVLTVALRDVSGMPEGQITALRADGAVWDQLRLLSAPLFAETAAINSAPQPARLATNAERIDLIVGELNRGREPYGTSFDDIAQRVPRADVHELGEQGHLAHLEAPARLAALMNEIRTR